MPTPKNKYLTPRSVRVRISAARAAIVRVEARLKYFQDRIADAQRRCPHHWEKLIDPAGGPASHECSICGRVM